MPKKKLIHRGAAVIARPAVMTLVELEIREGRFKPLDKFYDFSRGRITRDLGANAAEVKFPCGLSLITRAFSDYFEEEPNDGKD